MVKLASDGIISNSNYPLTLALKSGIVLGALSLICLITFIVLAICGESPEVYTWLFPFIGLLFAVDLTVKGFSDVYVARIYEEVKNRPVYIVKERFNDQSDD